MGLRVKKCDCRRPYTSLGGILVSIHASVSLIPCGSVYVFALQHHVYLSTFLCDCICLLDSDGFLVHLFVCWGKGVCAIVFMFVCGRAALCASIGHVAPEYDGARVTEIHLI